MSIASDPLGAAEEASLAALRAAGLEAAESALLFSSGHDAAAIPGLLERAVRILGSERLAGASSHGVLANGVEEEGRPAVGVLALAGLEAHSFLLSELASEEGRAGPEIAARIGAAPTPADLVLAFPDPVALAPDKLLASLDEALRPAAVAGAGSAPAGVGPALQWGDGRIATGAVSGMVVRGKHPSTIGITQACRPATGWMQVTRSQGNWLLELDGRPALDVYTEVAREPLAADLRRAAAFLLAALPRAGDSLEPGSYLVRNVVGFDPNRRSFAIGERIAVGDRLSLVLRNPESARADLKAMLGLVGGGPFAFGLYFDCCARASSLFGVSGLEAGYLHNRLRDIPLLGMLGSWEIGPIAGRTELLAYTGVLALAPDL